MKINSRLCWHFIPLVYDTTAAATATTTPATPSQPAKACSYLSQQFLQLRRGRSLEPTIHHLFRLQEHVLQPSVLAILCQHPAAIEHQQQSARISATLTTTRQHPPAASPIAGFSFVEPACLIARLRVNADASSHQNQPTTSV